MTKLHQVLAVVKDLDSKAITALEMGKTAFGNKGRYTGVDTTYQVTVEGNDERPSESVRMQGVLGDDLATMLRPWADATDVGCQVEQANRNTNVDVTVDGQTVLTGLSTPALMNLKHSLEALRNAVGSLPTLDLTENWTLDTQEKGQVYKTDTYWQWYTKKTFVPLVLDRGTDKHPAQVKEGWEDQNIGKKFIAKRSSAWTPAQKAILLVKLDALILGVKDAMERANTIEVETSKVSPLVLAYLGL